eukprot:1048706-Alexandrium_andersonii.AAC.1
MPPPPTGLSFSGRSRITWVGSKALSPPFSCARPSSASPSPACASGLSGHLPPRPRRSLAAPAQ